MSKKQSLQELMTEISNGVNGALGNPEIIEALVPYGYTEDRIRKEGLSAHSAVESLFIGQQKEYGEQYTATERFNTLWDQTHATYMPLLKLSRIALRKHHGALNSLRAEGERRKSVTGFVSDVRTFYQNLLEQPEWMSAMKQYSVTPEVLTRGLQQVADMEAAYRNFLKEKGEAQDATATRDKAFDDLYDWYSDFRAVARIALADRPQLLEKMGIVAKR